MGKFIHSPETVKKYRAHEKYFTRKRKLTFGALVLFIMNMPKRTLALELHDFVERFGACCRAPFQKITPSALTQGRHKLLPEVFIGIREAMSGEYYTDNEERAKLWKGLRLLGIDGSQVTLPYSRELEKIYGTIKNQGNIKDVIQARVSVLYDVLNEMVVDGTLSPNTTGEGALAHGHVAHMKPGDLITLDRGYPSFGLAFDILNAEAGFLFRCAPSFNKTVRKFSASDKTDWITEIAPDQKSTFKGKNYTAKSRLKVRLVKVPLKTGEVEILMCSLLDREKYPYNIFAGLYNMRWRVEVFYDRIKNILMLENFSGLTPHAILQDFYCALLISNIQSLLIEEAQMELDKKGGGQKYKYKVNVSLSLGYMKHRLIKILSLKRPGRAIKKLEALLLENPQPERKGRSFIRNHGKYRCRTKPPMFKNKKRNI